VNGSNFIYLNREGRWADLEHREGVTVAPNGQVSLRALPAMLTELPSDLSLVPRPDGAAGVAMAADGTWFYSVPSRNELWRNHPCGTGPQLIPCLNAEGQQSRMLQMPRGLLIHPIRRTLGVADSGNNRLVWFDLETFQLMDEWGSTGSQAGLFLDPWTIASDIQGNVYVTDIGNKRVQKFTPDGAVIPEFWDTVVKSIERASWSIERPVDVAVLSNNAMTNVFILDGDQSVVFVVDDTGKSSQRIPLQGVRPGEALSLAVTENAVYIAVHGADGRGKIDEYQLNGTLDGAVHGYDGPVAALRLSDRKTLLIHPGRTDPPFECPLDGGFRKNGFLWGGPFSTKSPMPIQWHLLSSDVERESVAGHLQLYVYVTGSAKAGPDPTTVPASWQEASEFGDVLDRVVELDSKRLHDSGANPARHRDRWIRLTSNTAHALLPGQAGDCLWLGMEFISDGTTSPVVSQVRIDWDHETYLQHLPGIYRRDLRSNYFLARFLSTYESLYRDVENRIAHLRDLFDPFKLDADLLPWLAGWLALDWNADWSELDQRRAIAHAFESYAWRGTPRGLRQAIRHYTGVDAVIEEPLLQAAWWMLPEATIDQVVEGGASVLGVTSMLVPAEAQGAVVGATAILDQSHLIGQAEFGVPLFSDMAYQFTVQVHQGQVQDERKLQAVQAVIEREKPAHTAHHLCIVKPMMRIGFQARLGIDTAVAGPSLPTRFGGMSMPQEEMVLGGPQPGEMGVMARAGMSTYLTEGSIDQKQR
jgi:phage tail-like protein